MDRVVEVAIDRFRFCKLVLSQVSAQFGPTSKVLWSSVPQVMPHILDDKKHLCLGFKLMVLRGPVEPYLLPAGRVAEVALAEDDPVERSRELEVHRHPALLAGDVEAGDLKQKSHFV